MPGQDDAQTRADFSDFRQRLPGAIGAHSTEPANPLNLRGFQNRKELVPSAIEDRLCRYGHDCYKLAFSARNWASRSLKLALTFIYLSAQADPGRCSAKSKDPTAYRSCKCIREYRRSTSSVWVTRSRGKG